jgi:hypothetical protein
MEEMVLEGQREVKELFEFVMDNADAMDAYSIEKTIFSRIMAIGLAAMKGYFAKKGTGDIGDVLQLEGGTSLKKEKRLLEKNYFSVFGKLAVPRACYRANGVNGVMPLDAQANLPERSYSYLLQEWMDLLSIRDSFLEGSVTLDNLLGCGVSASRFEVVSRESAGSYDDFYENKETPTSESEGEIHTIGFDGKGVPVIKSEAAKIQSRLGKGEKRQKTKEAIVGVSYSTDPKVRTPEEVAENLVYPERARGKREAIKKQGLKSPPPIRAKNPRRIASLQRSKEEVMKEIITDAKKRSLHSNGPLVVVMDGALCLWSLLNPLLKGMNWVGILDIIHVTEYLWKVGNALYGENTKEGRKWVYEHLVAILNGRVGRVIGGLKQILSKRKLKNSHRKALQDGISYFENHRQWMRYDEYLASGYPIGSGVVESTCGHTVKSRMEGTGRRWSIQGAESVLLLRSVYTSSDWDAYWETHRNLERQRLYGNILPKSCHADEYFNRKVA